MTCENDGADGNDSSVPSHIADLYLVVTWQCHASQTLDEWLSRCLNMWRYADAGIRLKMLVVCHIPISPGA